MLDIIEQKLKEIEETEKVKILYCVESGSRAWGFASPDSDYDVRFIYVREKEYYLRLDKTRDVIEWQLDDVLDINGWDISKALQLLHKSNPTLFEWNYSPIVYRKRKEWDSVSALINEYFVSKNGLYHYLNMARTNTREFLQGDKVKLKKYFYVLRPILACKWILKKGTPPPMLFSDLVKECLDEEIREEVERLLQQKINTPELGEGERIATLNAYIERNIEQIAEAIEKLPKARNKGWNKLNEAFLSLLED
ncbi:MAG: nucleotidyltransferase domain-containing protein [Clostridia bacterium]|nr:nucleotidyltransferase domain-containing protein [Clostridia bacterium]